MRNAVLAVVLLAALFAQSRCALGDATIQRTIDPTASKAQFGLEHIFVSRVTGRLPIVNGSVTLAAG